jgi:hypothetical protein
LKMSGAAPGTREPRRRSSSCVDGVLVAFNAPPVPKRTSR